MPKSSFKNNKNIAQSIKQRRIELGLTIEEAAQRAGIGTKTWSRYEAGNPIRKDKLDSIIRVLKWQEVPSEFNNYNSLDAILSKYRKHEAWSEYLYENFGPSAAVSFAIGSDIISDYVNEDLEALSEKLKGTHIGELENSFLRYILPEQFLMEYNYQFIYCLSNTIQLFRIKAKAGVELVAHSVLEEICLYLIMEESAILMENIAEQLSDEELEYFVYPNEWAYDIFDDMDVYTSLYSGFYLDTDNPFHFCHWLEKQFYVED